MVGIYFSPDAGTTSHRFFAPPTLATVARYFRHDMSLGYIDVKMEEGDFASFQLDLAIQELAKLVPDRGSGGSPYVVQISPGGLAAAPPAALHNVPLPHSLHAACRPSQCAPPCILPPAVPPSTMCPSLHTACCTLPCAPSPLPCSPSPPPSPSAHRISPLLSIASLSPAAHRFSLPCYPSSLPSSAVHRLTLPCCPSPRLSVI